MKAKTPRELHARIKEREQQLVEVATQLSAQATQLTAITDERDSLKASIECLQKELKRFQRLFEREGQRSNTLQQALEMATTELLDVGSAKDMLTKMKVEATALGYTGIIQTVLGVLDRAHRNTLDLLRGVHGVKSKDSSRFIILTGASGEGFVDAAGIEDSERFRGLAQWLGLDTSVPFVRTRGDGEDDA